MSDVEVEVVYALPEQQYLCKVCLPDGSTLEEAILRSGILAMREEIDLRQNRVGIFGRLAKLSDSVHDGDRVEIYRPLLADPKELRRRRAEQAKNNR